MLRYFLYVCKPVRVHIPSEAVVISERGKKKRRNINIKTQEKKGGAKERRKGRKEKLGRGV